MIQLIIGLVLGLVIVAFFIAAMYRLLPDRAVDKALGRFTGLFSILLDSTIGRLLDALFAPLTLITNKLIDFLIAIGQKAGPLAGFSIALLGLLRASRGMMAVISPEKSYEAIDGLQRATIVLLAMAGIGAMSRVARNAIKSRFFVPIMLLNASNYRPRKYRTTKKSKRRNVGLAIRVVYVLLVFVAVVIGIHALRHVVEIVRPNSRPAEILAELDLYERFELIIRQQVEPI